VRRALAALLALALSVSSLAGDAPPPRRKLKVAVLPYLSYAPFWLAHEQGLFAAQGLEVELVQLERMSSSYPSLAKGELDVGAAALSVGLLNLIARGARLRIVSDRGRADPAACTSSALVARKSLDPAILANPARWRGLRISTQGTSVFSFLVDAALRPEGLSLRDLEERETPESIKLEALKRGALDLAVLTEPWLTRARNGDAGVVVRKTEQVVPGLQWGVMVYGPSLLDDDPEAGMRFMAGYLAGVRRFAAGKTPRTLELVARVTHLPRELVEELCWPSFAADGRIDTASVLAYQAWAVEQGLVDRPLGAAQIWDPRFVEEAARRLEATQR
jgi:NitT/TauT family transport system substrate-binding protein